MYQFKIHHHEAFFTVMEMHFLDGHKMGRSDVRLFKILALEKWSLEQIPDYNSINYTITGLVERMDDNTATKKIYNSTRDTNLQI